MTRPQQSHDEQLAALFDVALDTQRAARFQARVAHSLATPLSKPAGELQPDNSPPGASSMARRVRGLRTAHRTTKSRRSPWATPQKLAIAAGALALIGGATLWRLASPATGTPPLPSRQPQAQHSARTTPASGRQIQVPAGAHAQRIDLEQGGVVLLTAGTHVHVASDQDHWQLLRGRLEAELPPRPPDDLFRVQVGEALVEVVGTHFAVERGMISSLQVSSGQVRWRASVATTSEQRLLDAGENLFFDERGLVSSHLRAHWPLNGSATAAPSPPLRQRGQAVRDDVQADHGLQPNQHLLANDVPLPAAGEACTISCRYAHLGAWQNDTRSILRHLDLDADPGRGWSLTARKNDGDWRLVATLHLQDGSASRIRLPLPSAGRKAQLITMHVTADRWFVQVDGQTIGSADLSAPPLWAVSQPLDFGPVPGNLSDVRIFVGGDGPP